MIELDAVEARVVGALVEKESTVPDSYPMTLNSLRLACNQSTSREPVVSYDDSTIVRALDALKERKVVRFVHASHGSRTTKYRHVLDEALGLDRSELALMSLLLLRGPQTLGELRTRAERQHAFGSLDEVEAALDDLRRRDPPLVRKLDRRPGQRDDRWQQLVAPEAALPTTSAAPSAPVRTPAATATTPAHDDDLLARVAALEAKVAELEQLLMDL